MSNPKIPKIRELSFWDIPLLPAFREALNMKTHIRVFFFPVGQVPELREIHSDLEGMQASIGGGFIERLGLTRELGLYCDADGRSKGLPFNCYLARPGEQGHHEIYGPMFICGSGGDSDDASISPKQLKQLKIGCTTSGKSIVIVEED